MAQFPYQFVGPMLQAMHGTADEIGTDVMGSQKSQYNTTVELLVLIAMVMRAIQDIAPATATDVFWQARLNSALATGGAGWPGWILLQIVPEDLPKYGGTLTDTRAQLEAKIAAWNAANPNG